MNEKTGDLDVGLLQLGSLAWHPVAVAVNQHARQIKTQTDTTPSTVITDILALLSLDNLRALQDTGSNNEEIRINKLAKAIFYEDMDLIANNKKVVQVAENVLQNAMTVAFYSEYMGDSGTLDWESYKKKVNRAVEQAVVTVVLTQAPPAAAPA